jgi:hypothetical protein
MATPSLLPKKTSLFPPQFGDALQPDLAGADPQAPMRLPGTPENSFAAYAANPLNHAKLPPLVPNNTPLPTIQSKADYLGSNPVQLPQRPKVPQTGKQILGNGPGNAR